MRNPTSLKLRGTRKKKVVVIPVLTKQELLFETEKISVSIRELKSEITERFEKHENIILAEYRHRIETLETKVRELQAGKK